MSRLRGLASGSFAPDCVSLVAPSVYNQWQSVELRVTQLPAKHGEELLGPRWLTEIRVDTKLTQHCIVHGVDAREQALAWLRTASAMLHAPGVASTPVWKVAA